MNQSEFAIASLVMGIVSFVQFMSFEKPVVAIIFGILALRKMNQNPQIEGRKKAIAGISLGIISIVISGIMWIKFWPQIKQWSQQTPMTQPMGQTSQGK